MLMLACFIIFLFFCKINCFIWCLVELLLIGRVIITLLSLPRAVSSTQTWKTWQIYSKCWNVSIRRKLFGDHCVICINWNFYTSHTHENPFSSQWLLYFSKQFLMETEEFSEMKVSNFSFLVEVFFPVAWLGSGYFKLCFLPPLVKKGNDLHLKTVNSASEEELLFKTGLPP